MATFKTMATFQFNASGWTETYYVDAVDHKAALSNLKLWASARRALLPMPVQMTSLRVSQVDPPVLGDSDISGLVGFGTYTKGEFSDPAHNALYARAQATALYRRQVMLRGTPDDIWDYANFLLTPDYEAAFNGFRDVLEQLPFMIRAKVKNHPLNKKVQLNNANMLPSPVGYTFHWRHANLPQVDNVIEMQFPVSSHSINRTWQAFRVEAVNQGNLSITVVPINPVIVASEQNAPVFYVRGKVMEYKKIDKLIAVAAGRKRDTGRPFGLSRGRASKRKLV